MKKQYLMGGGILVLAAVLAFGASHIHGDAGYAGIGPAFLPWLVSAVLALCGLLLMAEGRREASAGAGAGAAAVAASATTPADASATPDLRSMAWVSAGLLLNAALINHIGFILSCALLFALAARGFRRAMQQPVGVRLLARDVVVGLVISAPVYWMFTKGLGLTLPGLTKTGWL